ncbi:response regulator transcription factor [Frankia sp. R43]|uniref:response regulator n=1 Tax=Frankia sp. R43 TaxID=269536 RepID=UPI000A40FF58|nr:response regulator transcription factor [Frankia sp. R43]
MNGAPPEPDLVAGSAPPEARGPVRVLLVDDDPLVRAALRMILATAADVVVVGEAADGGDVVAAANAHRPDVVLMDVRMPGVDGIAATERVRALPRPPQVIVLTTFHLDDYVFAALRAGASGFLLKDSPPTEILQAVRTVADGAAMLSPAVTRTLIERFADNPVDTRRTDAMRRLDGLSEREREVATEVGHGLSNAEIAAKLYMSEATVKAHVSRLLTRLGAANRVQIAILVHNAGAI